MSLLAIATSLVAAAAIYILFLLMMVSRDELHDPKGGVIPREDK